jgi:pyridoxamine 5'-phosphate oxidase
LPSPDPLPAFYDDLDLSLAEVQRMIEQGAADRRSAAHSPVVATLDENGAPSQRVMILREIDWTARKLRFHTDARTDKVPARSEASVLFYDPGHKAQIRLGGLAVIKTAGNAVDEAWASSTPFARRCYMATAAPGNRTDIPTSGLPASIEGRQPEEAQLAPARANFALLLFEVQSIEWLYLANAGHRRARWKFQDSWQGSWLIP